MIAGAFGTDFDSDFYQFTFATDVEFVVTSVGFFGFGATGFDVNLFDAGNTLLESCLDCAPFAATPAIERPLSAGEYFLQVAFTNPGGVNPEEYSIALEISAAGAAIAEPAALGVLVVGVLGLSARRIGQRRPGRAA